MGKRQLYDTGGGAGAYLQNLPGDAVVVSTTGKISRELYEQSEKIYGNHDNIFMTVGGMGHASMIALGIAKKRPDKRVVCIDGDGAVLMHMGALPFIASQKPENFCHIVINNQAHESVGAMPTGCQGADFSNLAKAAGYVHAGNWKEMEDLEKLRYFSWTEKDLSYLKFLSLYLPVWILAGPKKAQRKIKKVLWSF